MPEKDYKNQIEAILFASGRLIDIDTIMNLTGASNKQVIINNIEKLTQEYEERDSPMIIVQEKEGWKLTVRELYLPIVRNIVGEIELPKTILETLAVIAWQAPVLQSNVIDIRHNKAYEHIAELEELGFIRKEKTGRSYMLKLTEKFFTYFEVDGNRGIREVLKEVKQPAPQTKVDEFEDITTEHPVGDLEVVDLPQSEGELSIALPSEDDVSEHVGQLEVYDEEESKSDEVKETDTFDDETNPAIEEKQDDVSDEEPDNAYSDDKLGLETFEEEEQEGVEEAGLGTDVLSEDQSELGSTDDSDLAEDRKKPERDMLSEDSMIEEDAPAQTEETPEEPVDKENNGT